MSVRLSGPARRPQALRWLRSRLASHPLRFKHARRPLLGDTFGLDRGRHAANCDRPRLGRRLQSLLHSAPRRVRRSGERDRGWRGSHADPEGRRGRDARVRVGM